MGSSGRAISAVAEAYDLDTAREIIKEQRELIAMLIFCAGQPIEVTTAAFMSRHKMVIAVDRPPGYNKLNVLARYSVTLKADG